MEQRKEKLLCVVSAQFPASPVAQDTVDSKCQSKQTTEFGQNGSMATVASRAVPTYLHRFTSVNHLSETIVRMKWSIKCLWTLAPPMSALYHGRVVQCILQMASMQILLDVGAGVKHAW